MPDPILVAQPVQLALGVSLPDHIGFDNFLPGPNVFALNSLRDVISRSGFNCVYLWGSSQSGKTHCLQAACNFLAAKFPVVYIPGRQFAAKSAAILHGMENQQLVCLDDLEAVCGLGEWERGLFNLYNQLQENRGLLCVSAEANLEQIGIHLPDLKSRLHAGLNLRLYPLSDDEKVQALYQRCKSRGIDIPPESVEFVLKRRSRDLASLYSFIDQLIERAITQQRRLTIPFIKEHWSSEK